MKVLHIISSMARGGRERQLATIFNHSSKKGLENNILVFNRQEDDYLSEYNIPVSAVHFLNKKSAIGRLNEIKVILKQFEPDVIYAWGGLEVSFCYFLIPFIKGKLINGSIRHGIVIFNKKHLSRFVLLHLSKYIVANSMAGLRANKLDRGFVLYNGIEKKFNKKLSDKEKIRLLNIVFDNYNGEPIIISVANLVPYKDYYTILKSLKNLKDKGFSFKYIAIGDGSMRKQLEKEIIDLGLDSHIKLIGRTDKVEQYLQSADLFVHSSKGEGCSNAILEAMSAGLPVIASNTGGTSEITGIENGQLFEYQNALQLTSALETHINNQEMLITKGIRSVEIVIERFTTEKMISNYMSILYEVVN